MRARLLLVMLLLAAGAPSVRGDVGAWGPGSAPADFDGDGQSDVLLLDDASDTLAIWLVGPGFTLKAGGGLPLPPGWEIRGVGKFDADAMDDLVLHHAASGDVVMWLMDGLSIRQGLPVGNAGALVPVAVDRFDRLDDGADLLLFDPRNGDLGVWRLAGGAWVGGGFLRTLTAGLQVAATGDFDVDDPTDGDADLLVYDALTGATELWLIEDGQFVRTDEVHGLYSQRGQRFPGGVPLDVAGIADDLAVVPETSGGGRLNAVGEPTFTTGPAPRGWWYRGCIGNPSSSFAWVAWLGEFDGDGVAEVLVQDPDDGYVGIWDVRAPDVPYPNGNCHDDSHITAFATLGGPLFTPAASYRVANQGPPFPERPLPPVSDFDGDGVSDVLLRNATTGALTVWLLTPASDVREQATLPLNAGFEVQTTGRIDSDLRADVVLFEPATQFVHAWFMQGTSVGGSTVLGRSGMSVPLFATRRDLDDREDDLILWHPDGTVGFWDIAEGAVEDFWALGRAYLGQRPVALAAHTCDPSTLAGQRLGPTLVFFDEKQPPTNGRAEWTWELDGGVHANWFIEQSAETVLRVGTDFDCDASVDRIGWDTPAVPGPLAVRAIDRNPAIEASRDETILADTRRGKPVALGDFDGDGDLDLLVQDPDDGDVLVWYLEGTLVVGDEKLVGEPGADVRVVTFGEDELPGPAVP